MSGVGTDAGSIRENYMTLLVTQLQNQNPLDPMDNSQMTSQLAQLAQLENLESLVDKFDGLEAAITKLSGGDTTFQKTLLATQVQQGMAMTGKGITFFPPGRLRAVPAEVGSLSVVDGEVLLNVTVPGGHLGADPSSFLIRMEDVISVAGKSKARF